MGEKVNDLVKVWAEHAMIPFQGFEREKIEKQLSLAIGTALKTGASVIEGLDSVQFAYMWDENNQITVEMDPEKFTEDMLVIKGAQWSR